MIIIPGNKRAIKKAIEKETKKNGALTREQKHKIIKKVHKRRARIFGIALALGIPALAVPGHKLLTDGNQQKETKVESQVNNKNKEFRERFNNENAKANIDENIKAEDSIEKQINELENEDEILDYLKDIYIEKYEQKTGDDKLNTSDIKIIRSSQDYVYINSETGETITHGDLPYQTKDMLDEDNISTDVEYKVDVYQIKTQDGKTIDCVRYKNVEGNNTPVKVIPGNEYSNMKNYESILEEMGTIIPEGFKYRDNLDDKNVKNKFINAVKEIEEANKEVQQENIEEER